MARRYATGGDAWTAAAAQATMLLGAAHPLSAPDYPRARDMDDHAMRRYWPDAMDVSRRAALVRLADRVRPTPDV
jgi:hypothetical protein